MTGGLYNIRALLDGRVGHDPAAPKCLLILADCDGAILHCKVNQRQHLLFCLSSVNAEEALSARNLGRHFIGLIWMR